MTNTITRATALEIAMSAITELAEDNALGIITEYTDTEINQVLGKMLASITKPRSGSGKPTKAAERNARLAAKVLQTMPEDVAVDSAWLAAHVDGFNVNSTTGAVSYQHVSAVMRLLVNAGKVSKAKVGKRMAYTRL